MAARKADIKDWEQSKAKAIGFLNALEQRNWNNNPPKKVKIDF